MLYSIEELKDIQIALAKRVVDASRWQDAAATELVIDIPAGETWVIEEITVQNLGAASVLDFYNALVADVLEANHKVSVDAKATDTTVVTGLRAVFTVAISVTASVCAVAHNLKIHVGGYKILP